MRSLTPSLLRRPAPPGGDDDSDDSQDIAEIAADLVAGFLLTDDQVTRMAAAIAQARLAAYRATYAAAASTMGVTLPADWQPDEDTTDACDEDAQASADGIAQTYQRDLTAAALAYLAQWRDDHDGDLAGASGALGVYLHGWATDRAVWKSEQVANAEAGAGANDGIDDASGDALDGVLLGPDGAPIDGSLYVVVIVPDDAAEPFCADYAGEMYDLSQYDELPDFPTDAHPNCIHEKWVVDIGGVDFAANPIED